MTTGGISIGERNTGGAAQNREFAVLTGTYAGIFCRWRELFSVLRGGCSAWISLKIRPKSLILKR